MHFVQDHEAAPVGEQEGFGIVHLTLRRRQLQVKIEHASMFLGFSKGDGGLARLAWPEEHDRRELGEQLSEGLLGDARRH